MTEATAAVIGSDGPKSLPRIGNLDVMITEGLNALKADGELSRFVLLDEGRAKAVFVSPDDGTSSDLAVNVIVLPAGFLNPTHSHMPEELLVVLHGSGIVVVDEGAPLDIGKGDVVVLPPLSRHSVEAGAEGPLVFLAVMARTRNDSAGVDVK